MNSHSRFITDADLSEAEFVEKYTSGEMKIGDSDEVKEYLKTKHRYFNKNATWQQVNEAYNKTDLSRSKACNK